MIRLLHAADLHLDSPFAALAPAQAALRRQEQRALVVRLCEKCAELDCDALLLAGDLFDSATVYRETAETLMQALAGCGVPVFIAPGNHDCLCPGSPYRTLAWPENVHIFQSPRPEAVELPDLGLTVWGAAFLEPEAPSLLEGFCAPDGGVQVMVLHGDPDAPASRYNPISRAQIEGSHLDYLALGHIHKDSLRRDGKTTAVMPGCAIGRGFDETGTRGAVLAVLDERGCRVEPVPLGGREYRTLTVRVEGDPLAAIRAALPPDTVEHLYRITLTGDCELPDLRSLTETLRPSFYSLRLIDRTLPPLSLWQAAGENTLKGEFLRILKTQYDAAEPDQKQTVALAARYGLAVMEGRDSLISDR